MHLDRTTEAIAHFIGQFDISVEEARLRNDYDDFRLRQAAHADEQSSLHRANVVSSPLDLTDFTPDFRIFPRYGEDAQNFADPPFMHPLPQLKTPLITAEPDHPALTTTVAHGSVQNFVPPQLDPPGSIVLYLNQHIELSDNDYLSAGGSGLSFHPISNADAQLASLAYSAEQLSPLSSLQQPNDPTSIATHIYDARAAIDDFVVASENHPEIAAVSGETLVGAYVNGEAVSEAPLLQDYMPEPTIPPAADPENPPPTFVAGEGNVRIESGVALHTGGNLVVNETHISNIGLGSAVIAVAHDAVELNAIVQVNAIADHDQVSAQLTDWVRQGSPSQTFNVAQFDRVDPLADAPAHAQSTTFPSFWTVCNYQGDLVFMNWVKQFAFVNDDDVVIASSSGAISNLATGANQSINVASISDLGQYYDLVVCGGSIYSANTITQINVLVDNDMVGAVAGFHTSGQGSVSTDGDLLWNSASILNIGGDDRFQALPSAYQATINDMANGQMTVASGVLGDTAFAGLDAVRVLYVSGNIYSLNSVEQHTIVGDSDQVALAMSAVAADPTANWSVVTGTNTLANIASIVSLDSMGKTYVGGAHYSDAMLVQSGLVQSASGMQISSSDPDAIVNEAVAFLIDSPTDHPVKQDSLPLNQSIAADHHAQTDVMHGILS